VTNIEMLCDTFPIASVIKGPPAHVRLGPLTQRLLSGPKWQESDSFPASQVWADDVESVLAFLDREGRLPAFLDNNRKTPTPQHRDASLAEARAAYFLNQNCFRIVEWEPEGEGNKKGDALVSYPGAPEIFVEVKQPGWRGEHMPLSTKDRNRLSLAEKEKFHRRKKQEKFLPDVIEAGTAAPHRFSMSVVRRNALQKLSDKRPNVVIVVDDCIVSVVGLPFLAGYVQQEFLCPARNPDDPDDHWTYERLGGVLFLQPESRGTTVEYKVDFVVNPNVLPPCALPLPVVSLFSKLRDITEEREKLRYACVPSFSEMLKKKWARHGTNSRSS